MTFMDFGEWLTKRRIMEAKSKSVSPDYTLDKWITSVNRAGDEVDSFVGKAKQKDADLDKKLDQSKKDKDKVDADKDQDSEEDKDLVEPSGDAWDVIKKLAKERAAEFLKKKEGSKSEKKK